MAKQDRQKAKVEVLCQVCNTRTKHTLRGTYKTSFYSEDISGNSLHELLSCDGCDAVTYRETSWSSEDMGEGPSVTLYPPRGEKVSSVRIPREFDQLWGKPLESVYRQTVTALNNKSATLAAAGIRMLIEGTCKDCSVKNGEVTDKNGNVRRSNNLDGKINGLVEHGFISKKQAVILHELRFLGNDAAHDLDQPSVKLIDIALDITEHIINQVYEQPAQAKSLENRKRPPKA